MRKSTIALIAAMALAAPLAGAQTTQRLTATKANEYALVYTLPLTRIEVALQAEKTERFAGPFALYSRQLMKLDPVMADDVSWQLTAAEILPGTYADDSERYQVQFKNGAGVTMGLTSDGFPLWVNLDGNAPEAPAPAATTLKARAPEPTPLQGAAASQAVTEDMLKATSVARRAQLAAARIFEIRQNRSELLSGQADNMPSDGAALQLALDGLAAQEEAMTAMFAGATATSAAVEVYEAQVPMADDPTTFVVARLSPTLGLLPPDDLRGEPITLSFTDIVTADLPVNDKGIEKTFPKGGLAYRIPGEAMLEVAFKGRVLARARMAIAQYGTVFGIDPALFTDKKERSTAQFSPLTGALVTLGVER